MDCLEMVRRPRDSIKTASGGNGSNASCLILLNEAEIFHTGMSESGTKRSWRDVRVESVFGGNAEVAFQGRQDRF
jgi:hypothetical protein